MHIRRNTATHTHKRNQSLVRFAHPHSHQAPERCLPLLLCSSSNTKRHSLQTWTVCVRVCLCVSQCLCVHISAFHNTWIYNQHRSNEHKTKADIGWSLHSTVCYESAFLWATSLGFFVTHKEDPPHPHRFPPPSSSGSEFTSTTGSSHGSVTATVGVVSPFSLSRGVLEDYTRI